MKEDRITGQLCRSVTSAFREVNAGVQRAGKAPSRGDAELILRECIRSSYVKSGWLSRQKRQRDGESRWACVCSCCRERCQ